MKTAPTVLVVLLAACSAATPVHEVKGYRVIGSDPFVFEVERGLLREWGGAGSVRFNEVLEGELERLRLCRDGYALRNEGVRDDVFRATGRCRR